MSKPRMYGKQTSYIPNAQADMRYRRKLAQRGQEIAERNTCNPKSNRRLEKEIRRQKEGK